MKIIFYLMLFAYLVFSCKKDTVNPSIVYAGVQNEDMYTKVFSPAKEIIMTFDSQNLYGAGSDSIDIDNDGIFDFIFYLNYYNPDSVHLITSQYPNPTPSFVINFKEGISMAKDSVLMYTGLGTVTFFKYATAFKLNQQISFYKTWQKNSLKIWTEIPVGNVSTYGEWYSANETRYIGFQKNSKLGWIKVDITSPKNPKIISYSIQN